MPKDLKRTELYLWHKEHGAQMVEFAGWEMPVSYKRGILEGHLPSESRYLLVVNAANKEKNWNWLMDHRKRFKGLTIEDKSDEMGMIALQGPMAKRELEKIVIESHSKLPDPWRNRLRVCEIEGVRVAVTISRTGYTGEPICFELFSEREKMRMIWEAILTVGGKEGIAPVGL